MSARDELEDELHEYAMMLDASRLVKAPGLRGLRTSAVFYFQKNQIAVVETDAATAEAATAIGERVRKNLISRRVLTSAEPSIHNIPLYVGYLNGTVELAAVEKEARDTEKQDARRSLMRRGQAVFGSKGIAITGHDGAYEMELRPHAKYLRGKFSATRVRRATLEELDAVLDQAIEMVESR